MKKRSKTANIFIVTFGLFNLLLIIALVTFYVLDVFYNLVFLPENIILYSLFFLVVFDFVGYGLLSLTLSKLNFKRSVHIADIIGLNKASALNFALTHYVITDADDIIIWISEGLKDVIGDYYYKNIFTIIENPAFITREEELGKQNVIKIDDKYFELKIEHDAHIYIFKEVTEYVKLELMKQNESPVYGILSIDNYTDSLEQNEVTNAIILKTRNEIQDYFKEYRAFVVRVRPDFYYILLARENFQKIKDDNFSIVDTIRGFNVNNKITITISLAFAYDYPDYNSLNENVSHAIDIAKERGGDQTVTSRFGSDLEFYGGHLNRINYNDKSSIHIIADKLSEFIEHSENVIICGHTDTDLDAIGSALGIKAIADRLEKPAYVVFDMKLAEKHARNAVITAFPKNEFQKIFVTPKEALAKVKSDTLLILVDVQIPSLLIEPKLIEKTRNIIVIDHHRRGQNTIDLPLYTYIDPDSSSASELVIELIEYSSLNPRVKLSPAVATLMLGGIFLDTNYFRSKELGIRTFEAATALKKHGADNTIADDYLKGDLEEYKLISSAIKRCVFPFSGVAISSLDEEGILEQSLISKISESLIQLSGVEASFIIGLYKPNEIKISARSNSTINVQVIMEKLGGGGHFTAAAAVFANISFVDVYNKLVNAIEEYFDDIKK